jgi:DNA (cytosine-5)-methyltransferase 1
MDALGPAWLVGENVPGLTYHTGECDRRGDPMDCPGCYFEAVILRDLRARFTWVDVWKLDAADYGVPQHRRRIFIVAGPHPVAKPRPTHCDPGLGLMLASGFLPWVSVADALDLHGSIVAAGETGEGRPRDVCHASPTMGTKGTAYLLGPSPAVTCVEVKGRSHDPTKMQKASDALFLATGRRRLTIAECATLQDFPDDHPWQGTKTAQYRQVGNAVPPTLARVVAESILQAAEKRRSRRAGL